MSHDRIVEDRVFGRPETYPSLPIVTKPSSAYDLLSVGVEGAEVAYAMQGTVNHPPLVFLHGWGASHKFWRCAFSAFSPRYRCVAPDLAGFGLSEKPGRDYSISAYAVWLGKFLDALHFPRVTLVGHSMGGTIALQFALDHPDRVEKLALVNPLLEGATAFGGKIRFMMMPLVRSVAFAMLRSEPLRRWIVRDFTFARPLDDELAADAACTTYSSAIDSLRSCLGCDLRPRLGELRVPVLSVGTDHDRVIVTRQYEWVPAGQKALISGSGHVPIVERPADFNALLDGFLRS
ncbi:MAG TPA: alpha/beta hydrolase [Planctomycetota bacterium]|nr:alpha/beta hydrolase [Planctomycetota bacterium]